MMKKTSLVKLEQRNNFKVGDKIEIFGPQINSIKLTITKMYDENKEPITVAPHPKQIVYIEVNTKLYKNNLVRKLIDKDTKI